MFIKSISSYNIDHVGRTIQRVTNYGQYKGISFAIDNYNYKGTTLQKRFVAWSDTWQIIRNKIRGKDGKFKRLGYDG